MIQALFSNIYLALSAAALLCVGGYFTWKALTRSKTAAAATDFRAAISTRDFTGMRGPELRAALNEAFPVQMSAAREFRHRLGFLDRVRFDKVWNDYHGGSEKYPDFAPYFVRGNGPDLLAQRLEALRNMASRT